MARKKKTEEEFVPSSYQKAIFEFVQKGQGNAVIEATPGSGKSTVLLKCLEYIPKGSKILLTAFNTDIVEELKKKTKKMKLDIDLDIRTIHSLGYSILMKNYGSEIERQPNEFKYSSYIYNNIKQLGGDFYKNLAFRDHKNYIDNIKKLVDFGRFYLCQSEEELKNIADKYSFSLYGNEPEIALQVMDWGKLNYYTIDFTDMVWLPLVLNCKPYGHLYDWVLADECFPARQTIATDKGKVSFGRLNLMQKYNKPLPKAKSYNNKTKEFEYKQITKVWNRGERKLIKISLGTKRKVRCTPNERFLTLDGYKYASELNIGDYICASYKRQPYHCFLNDDQKELFQALAIGDGHEEKISYGIHRMKLVHGALQKDYFDWKFNMFNQNGVSKFIEKNGCSQKPAYTAQTCGYCIKDEESTKEYIVKNLSLKQLAINYCDNGSFIAGRSSLYSCVNDYKLVELLQQRIKELGIDDTKIYTSKSSTTNRQYWYIVFSTKATHKLHSLIAPYMHENLKYKLYEEYHDKCGTYKWDNSECTLGGITITNIEDEKPQIVYDIEVEDNHNFILTSEGNTVAANDGPIVHNCQDLEKQEQELILHCTSMSTRMLFVGEIFQSIYGFKGSNSQSFNELRALPNTISLPLSISYRCAKNIVKYANRFNSQMLPKEDAIDGEVKKNVNIEEIEDGDMVLCRVNAPLLQLYCELSKLGKPAYIRGKDIGTNLIKSIKKTKENMLFQNLKQKGVFSALYDDLFSEIDRVMKKHSITFEMACDDPTVSQAYDNIQALEAISDGLVTTEELIEKITNLFSDKKAKGISLSTIHKAKGLEADNVFICCPSLMPAKSATQPWELQQEANLEYVAYTRAKKKLCFLNEDNFTMYSSNANQKASNLAAKKSQVFMLHGSTTRCGVVVPSVKAAREIIANSKEIKLQPKNAKEMKKKPTTFNSISAFQSKKKVKRRIKI